MTTIRTDQTTDSAMILANGIARWENEGGAPAPPEPSPPSSLPYVRGNAPRNPSPARM